MKLSAEDKQIVKDYGSFIVNTGGNEIVELVERTGVTIFNNAIVALMQSAVSSQITLLRLLKNEGLLKEPKK